MLGLTNLGLVHTVISLVAVVAAAVALWRDRRISAGTRTGRIYVVATVLSCATALGIFQHGGFGKPHALALITLAVLGLAAAARLTNVFGRASVDVETVSYSATLLFHLIPAITETATRLPSGAPLAASPEDPVLQLASGLLFVLFLAGATAQVWHRRTSV